MMDNNFDDHLKEELDKYSGIMVPVKASRLECAFVKKAAVTRLHPNPDDEFSRPDIGPNYSIISDYIARYNRYGTMKSPDEIVEEPLYEVWIYTSSFRTEAYIRHLFRWYGVVFDGIVNGTRHLKEVQRDHSETLPQKLPSHYRISLHIDDESIVCSMGRQYGYNVYQLDAHDEDWKDKIIAQAEMIRKRESV